MDTAATPVTAAERQTREHADRLLDLLPAVEDLAGRVALLYQERRIAESGTALHEAFVHLGKAFLHLATAQGICATATEF